jgi:PPE-repeat protein
LATFAADIPLGSLGVVALPLDVVSALTGTHTDDIVSGWNGEEAWPGDGPAPVRPFPAQLLNLPAGTVPPPSVAANLGEANTVGGLSVPPTWSIATPAVRPTAVTLPALPAAAVAADSMSGASGSALSEMALAGMAGRAMGGTVGTGASRGTKTIKGAAARTNTAPKTADPKPTGSDDAVAQTKPRTVVTGVAAELREFAKLRDEGILTDQEYTEQKNRLLGR